MPDRLAASDADLLAYYHLTGCAWVKNPRHECSCGLLDRVAAVAEARAEQVTA